MRSPLDANLDSNCKNNGQFCCLFFFLQQAMVTMRIVWVKITW